MCKFVLTTGVLRVYNYTQEIEARSLQCTACSWDAVMPTTLLPMATLLPPASCQTNTSVRWDLKPACAFLGQECNPGITDLNHTDFLMFHLSIFSLFPVFSTCELFAISLGLSSICLYSFLLSSFP